MEDDLVARVALAYPVDGGFDTPWEILVDSMDSIKGPGWRDVDDFDDPGDADDDNDFDTNMTLWRIQIWIEVQTAMKAACTAPVGTTVFLNMGFVEHNIHLEPSDNEVNKELVVLLKRPYEVLTMDIVRERVRAVEPCLRRMHAYHTDGRCFYPEGLSLASNMNARRYFLKYLAADESTAPCYMQHMIDSANKCTVPYPERGDWAEVSSLEYYRVMTDPAQPPVDVWTFDYGS